MPSRTYSADVVANFIGKDKSLGRTTHEVSREVTTMRDKFKLAGHALRQFATGDAKGAKKSFGDLRVSMGSAAIAAAGIGAAVVAGIATAVAAVTRLITKYVELGKQIGAVSRLTGVSGDEANDLRVQWKMLGIDVETASKTMGRFGANLYASRKGTGLQAEALAALGVGLKDSTGGWRSNADILDEVRDKLSQLKKTDLAQYQGVSKALFGRGFMVLDKWLAAAPAKIAKFKKIAEASGVDWDKQNLTKMLEDTREMGIIWEDFQVMLASQLMPLLRDELIPAMRDMVTQLRKIPDLGKKMKAGMELGFGPIKSAGKLLAGIAGVLGSILTLDFSGVFDSLKTAFQGFVDYTVIALGGPMGWLLVYLRNKYGGGPDPGKGDPLLGGVPVIPPPAHAPSMALGGYVPPKVGGTIVRVGEAGQGEYVIPKSKMGGGTVHVHIGTLVGTDERAARQLADMVGRHLMRGVSRGMVGQNA